MTVQTIRAWAYKHKGKIDLMSISETRGELGRPNTAAGQSIVALEIREIKIRRHAIGENEGRDGH